MSLEGASGQMLDSERRLGRCTLVKSQRDGNADQDGTNLGLRKED